MQFSAGFPPIACFDLHRGFPPSRWIIRLAAGRVLATRSRCCIRRLPALLCIAELRCVAWSRSPVPRHRAGFTSVPRCGGDIAVRASAASLRRGFNRNFRVATCCKGLLLPARQWRSSDAAATGCRVCRSPIAAGAGNRRCLSFRQHVRQSAGLLGAGATARCNSCRCASLIPVLRVALHLRPALRLRPLLLLRCPPSAAAASARLTLTRFNVVHGSTGVVPVHRTALLHRGAASMSAQQRLLPIHRHCRCRYGSTAFATITNDGVPMVCLVSLLSSASTASAVPDSRLSFSTAGMILLPSVAGVVRRFISRLRLLLLLARSWRSRSLAIAAVRRYWRLLFGASSSMRGRPCWRRVVRGWRLSWRSRRPS